RDDPLRARNSADAGHHGVPAPFELAVQHAQPPRPPPDADRQPGLPLDRGRGTPREGELPLLHPEGRLPESLLHGQRAGVPEIPAHRPEEEMLTTTPGRPSSK